MMRETKPVPAGAARASERMLMEHRGEHPSDWTAMCSISAKFGMTPKTPAPLRAAYGG